MPAQVQTKSIVKPSEAEHPPNFSVSTNLVVSTFEFHPNPHKLVTELRPIDITVLDNDALEKVAVLESARTAHGRVPIDILLLFDCGSNFRRMFDTRHVLDLGILREMLNVRVGVYGFSDVDYRLLAPTGDIPEVVNALGLLQRIPDVPPRVANPILETMADAVTLPGVNPRILVIFSGGVGKACKMPKDNYTAVVAFAKDHNIKLFPVAVQDQSAGLVDASVSGHDAIRRRSTSNGGGIKAFESFLDIGRATGGKGFFRSAMPEKVLNEILTKVTAETQWEYTVGFYPTNRSAGMHIIKVTLHDGNLGQISDGTRSLVY